jgi:hypothetical protein
MRKTLSRSMAALLALAMPFLASCGGTSIDFWFEKDLVVDQEAPAGGIPPEVLEMLANDPANNSRSDFIPVDLSQFDELKDKFSQLKEVIIPEIWLEFTEVGAENNAKSISGELKFSETYAADQAQADAAKETATSLAKIDLSIETGNKNAMTFDAEPQRKLQELARSSGKFTMFYTVKVTAKEEGKLPLPAKFKVKARVHVQATVSL